MIILHYYSDQLKVGLPRLRFSNVPYDFDIWNVPSASYKYREVAAVPPGDPAGNRSMSINNNLSTQKILMN